MSTTSDGSPRIAPTLVIGTHRIPVVLPDRRDARLKLSLVIVTLQVLGQVLLGFKVSPAQIIVTVGFCAVVDISVTLWRTGVLVWPASALLTGNSIAFILRASGTGHGDWWTLHGIHLFLLAAAISLLVKYVVRPAGRHRFNPSNVGLVAVLVFVGPGYVFPQYLWWGSIGVPVVLAVIVIALGAMWVLRAVSMLEMAGSFILTFGVVIAVLAASGAQFVAIWSPDPIKGAAFWWHICASPEVLIFVCFMMSDPATTPKHRSGRIAFGAAVAVVAALLTSFQDTEYGIKLAILASLTIVCAFVPLIERLSDRDARLSTHPSRSRVALLRAARRRPLLSPATAAVVAIAACAFAGTVSVATNRELILLERGLTAPSQGQ